MSSMINTNLASLNAQNNLNKSQSSLATSLQRLSSGLRINSAKDDAAGMAISDRMTSQIRGTDQASRNANDAISLTQTAEGDLSTISDNLQRMRELAVQSSNASNSASDRVSIDNEVQSLSAEIDRVAQNSSFNGNKLLDGSFVGQNFQVGANATANDTISVAIGSARTSTLGGVGTSNAAKLDGGVTTTALAAGDLTLNGFQVGTSALGAGPGQSAASAYSTANVINAISANSGVTATANINKIDGAVATSGALAADTFSINGINVGAIEAGTTGAGQGANVAAAINKVATQTGVTAIADATTGKVSLTAIDGRDINLVLKGTATNPTTAASAKANFLTNTGLVADQASAVVAGTGVATASTFTVANATTVGGTIAAGTLTVNGTAVGAITLTTQASNNTVTAGSTTAAAGTTVASAAAGTTAGTLAAGALVLTTATGAVNVGAVTLGTNAKTNGDAIALAINTAAASLGGGAGVNGTAVADATGIITFTAGSAGSNTLSLGKIAIDSATAGTNQTTLIAQTGFTAGQLGTQANGGTAYNSQQVVTGINAALAATTGGTAVNGSVAGTATTGVITFTTGSGAGNLMTGIGNTAKDATTATSNTATLATQTGLSAAQLGTQAAGTNTTNHGTVTLNSTSASGIVFGGAKAASAGFSAAGGTVSATVTSAVKSIASINVLTAANASSALSAIDGALSTINTSRAALGSYQNRFASVVSNLQTTSENLTASRSRIQDTDFAKETASLTRGQILQQAGTAMLAQANSLPNGVMALLRG
ncbi:MAG: flagellin [Burkholderiaceae bacterium]